MRQMISQGLKVWKVTKCGHSIAGDLILVGSLSSHAINLRAALYDDIITIISWLDDEWGWQTNCPLRAITEFQSELKRMWKALLRKQSRERVCAPGLDCTNPMRLYSL